MSSMQVPMSADSAPAGLARVLETTSRVATSWLGLITAYVIALVLAFTQFKELTKPLSGIHWVLQIGIVFGLPLLAFLFHTIPTFFDQRRRKQLTEISGTLQSGYFTLAPRENQETFQRTDGMHEEVLRWLSQRNEPLLYLTGLSGSGKSSLLAAWVLPKLIGKDYLIIRLRGYQDPLTALRRNCRSQA